MTERDEVEAACAGWYGEQWWAAGPPHGPSEPVRAMVRRKMRAALDAAAKARWRPIETAPKDGRLILVAHWWKTGGEWIFDFLAWAENAAPYGCWRSNIEARALTHDGLVKVKAIWQPLPPPPGAGDEP